MNIEGSFVELVLAVRLKADTPQEVLDLLRFMTKQSESKPTEIPEHPFFECNGWDEVLQEYDSGYFDGRTNVIFLAESGYLTVRAYEKYNADGEFEKFVDWLVPYCRINSVEKLKFIGYIHSSDRLHPTLIYINDRKELFFQELNLLKAYDREHNVDVELGNAIFNH